MNVEVRYLSKSGNTKKVADAIASALAITAKPISQEIPANTDLLFLGGAVYAAGIDKQLKEFIHSISGKTKEVAIFSTSAILPSAYPQMKKVLESKGFIVAKDEFHCRGEFMKLHKGHPNGDDLSNAKQFARKFIKE
jgi:flavodoxin